MNKREDISRLTHRNMDTIALIVVKTNNSIFFLKIVKLSNELEALIGK